MLDMIIREAAAKFGLGDKSGMIVSALLGMMFKKDSGGLGGFLDMFKQKGLANLATSWLGGGSGLPLGINPTQLENVVGGDLMKGLASKTGLPIGPISSALAFMLPNIVRSLTADGKVPTGIPAAISQYMSGDGASAAAGAGAAAVGAAAASVGAAGKAAVGSAAEKAAAAASAAGAAGKAALGGAAGNVAGAAASMAPAAAGGLPKWLWVLIPVVLALGWFLMRKPAEAPVAVAPKAAPAVEAPKPAPVVEAPKPTEAPTPVPTPAAAAPKDAGAQLDALKAAGNVSGEDLVKALNMTNIRFATGSATITPESMEIVKKAAETIKAAAAGTKIEVGGHTDNVGNPASNMKLSDARAQSVLSALAGLGVGKGVLSAKGYGDSKPVAANDTTENKAKNRRMEYSLVK